jgi:hypothetical protein
VMACDAGKDVYVEKPFRITCAKAASWWRPRAATIASRRWEFSSARAATSSAP